MAKPRKKSPRRPRQTKGSSSQTLNGDLFRIVAETAIDILVTIDEHSRILFINPAVERVLGYRAKELIGREITILMPDYVKGLPPAAIGGHLAAGKTHILWTAAAITGLHRTGREVPLEVSIGEQVHDGKHIFTGILRDVSGRQRIEEELRQSNQKYIRMIQSSPDAITLRTLPERRYLEVNQGFCRMTGYAAEEVIGKTSAELNVWADPEQRGATLQKVLREGEVQEEEFRFRTKSGEIRFGQLAAVTVAVGNQQCMLSISRDITERRRAEEELRRSEANFRSLVHDAPFGVLKVTLEGRILQANPALVKMLGYASEEEVCKLNMARDVYHVPKQRQRLVEEHLQKNEFHNVEVQWKRKDGNTITALLNGRRVAGPDGAQTYFEEFAEDITQRRILERQLFQSQKMEAIGRLAGGIAHDFNNLLGVILGHTEILEGSAGRDRRLPRSVEAIQSATQRAAALTTQLLAFSRKQMVEPRILDLNVAVREIEELLRRVIGEDVELLIRTQPGSGTIRIDPGQLDQILMNLVVNARDAMLNGGKLVLETSAVILDDSYVGQHLGAAAGPFVVLSISDTGCGMDQETLSHIFEPFFTTKEKGKGTGLGLSTVYGIVKHCGGYIMAYSEPGRGTTFKVYFPHVSGAPEAPRASGRRAEVPGGKETVLLVEDETALRELTRGLLETAGYTVLEAAKVEDAIRLAESAHCKIDLLLTDVVMPGMDGHELSRRLTSSCPSLKVLYMSGYTDDVIVHKGVLNRGTTLLQKPFGRAGLLGKVRQVLDS
ncbi:MAG TPA: PAS domain S-box protein [Candidatus Acidoferrum sp.]|nr:PAS domain S-box protein [Candidatus Acidoferrum sp.]